MFDLEELTNRLSEKYGVLFIISTWHHHDSVDLYVQLSEKSFKLYLTRFGHADYTTTHSLDGAMYIVEKAIVEKIRNLVALEGHNLMDGRKFFFGSTASSTWQKRATTGENAPGLNTFFNTEHRSSPSGEYNVIFYHMKHLDEPNPPFLCYRKENGKHIIEKEADSPVYASLLARKNASSAGMELILEPGIANGVHVDAMKGRVYTKPGLHVGVAMKDAFVVINRKDHIVVYEVQVGISTSFSSSEPEEIYSEFFEHDIKVDPNTNQVLYDVKKVEDPGVFHWIPNVKCRLDFECNPRTSRSSFAHIVETDVPKYISDNVWICSQNKLYIHMLNMWVPLKFGYQEAFHHADYIPEAALKDLKYYQLAEQLAE